MEVRSRAFTLVEVLIVVVILGILAAIVVPQFTDAADDAKGGSLATQIRTITNQLELYQAREGEYPPIFSGWTEMIDGGYLKAAPVNPVNGLTNVRNNASGSSSHGWHFQTSTGIFGASYFDETEMEVTDTPQ